ncbi:hypothetical protein TVAG_475630 [Trichomonas vaginalis G3]|uniref:Importin subunit alpha n=1 Tax=Trichomonas vaginalis (strain ATCC PRA-98 / G3) TaxID=412133 RepID=A2D9Y7_TRIV3|nr:nuclear import signal receptor protein [Trichomonas vaginalis G3]EAY22635.1 hypothetical protein TVAG_475630 [Trichomonas vaginalis G3]KAI5525449.1 nuclear import signal receptor protein [Trichomonas vaginalis G3]|eukprot:XP_001583621.1 hypothetical protein [Trichomonas vaginalis G3]
MSCDSLSDLGLNGHFGQTGATITGYFNQLSKERTSLTLKIRRESFNAMNVLLKRDLKVPKPKVLNSDKDTPLLQPENAIAALQSDSENTILTFLNEFIINVQANSKSVSRLVSNENFITNLTELFNNEYSSLTTIALFQVTAIIFQQSKLNRQLVDSDIIATLSSLILADESDITTPLIALIGSIAASSAYARDALLCFGIHFSLIDKIKQTEDESLKEATGKCLCIIFGGPHPYSSDVVHDCIQSLIQLLENASIPLIQSILTILIDMTNKVTETVYLIYDLGLFPFVIETLQNPELRTVALALCGNLTVSQPMQAKKFMDLGLYDILMNVMSDDDDAPYALWILSNLLDSIPTVILPLLTMEMILQCVQATETSTSEFKQEVTYFVGTIIIVAGTEISLLFLRQEIFDLLVEMLGCGIYNIIVRCIDSLQKIALSSISTGHCDQYSNLIHATDFPDRVEELDDSDNPIYHDKIESLQKTIEDVENQ